jgi:phage terminase small subunit
LTTNLKPLDTLSLKHRLFVPGMIMHKGDKTKAARSAGYSPKTCVEQGYQLFIKLQD